MTTSLRDRFSAFDDILAEKECAPPLTQWWRSGVGRWLDTYERGGAIELWACTGRGGGRTTVLRKLALFFAIEQRSPVVPLDELHVAALIVTREASARERSRVRRWAEALGIQSRVTGNVAELVGERRGVLVAPASVAGVTGYRAFFVGRDDYSRWDRSGPGEEDRAEIGCSLAATTLNYERAPVVSVGPMWRMDGACADFREAISVGDTDERVVLGPAPTWIAQPAITEATTRRKALKVDGSLDHERWARDYACEAPRE